MSTNYFSETASRSAIWFQTAKEYIIAAVGAGSLYRHDQEDNLAIQAVMLGDAILSAFDARFGDAQGGRGAPQLALQMKPEPTPTKPSPTLARINEALSKPMSDEERLDQAVAFLEKIRLEDEASDKELLPLPKLRRFGR
mgnify:CR=1 FL=1|jgi:hypothetical protein